MAGVPFGRPPAVHRRGGEGVSNGGRSGGSGTLIVVGVVVVAIIVLAILSRPEPPLERTATGMQGLVAWLKKNDEDARVFFGGQPLIRGSVSLRILPLYDTDLLKKRKTPETRDEVIAQTTDRDLMRHVFRGKVADLPTLVVLPKWKTGMRALGMAHGDLLIPADEMNRLLSQIGLDGARVRIDAKGFVREPVNLAGAGDEIAIMHPQTVTASGCTPILGTADNMLLGDCRGRGRAKFWLLTDPDLLSNHGLAHAGNARVALAVVRELNGAASVVVDASADRWVVDSDPFTASYERRWEDFARMFAWPFTMIWIGFFAVGALVLWRAIVRYGPLARVYPDEPQASKTVSISAKARLLRLANHDEALLKSHIRARLQTLAADLLGPHRKAADPLAALLPMIKRTDPALASEFAEASRIDETITDVMTRLDRFEDCHDRIKDEFGRTASAGRRTA